MQKIYKKGGGYLLEETPFNEIFIPEDFSEEQRMISKTAEDFIMKEVIPKTDEIENKNEEVILGLMKKAGELGFLGADVSQKYGGMETDKISSMIIAEKMSLQGSFGVTWGTHIGIGTLPIALFGTEEQKKKYLPKLISGEWIGCYALTEPQAGSDAMNIKTTAKLEGDFYVLNGQKQFITNSGFGNLFITFAKVDGDKFSAFIIEKGTPGFKIGKEENKMGIRGSSTCPIFLENAKIHRGNLLGEIGKGHRIAFNILNIGRYKLGAAVVGGAKFALKDIVSYAKERVQFGKPIVEFGLIQSKIASCASLIYGAESASYRLSGLLEENLKDLSPDDASYSVKVMERIREYAVECAILKVFNTEVLDWVVDEAVQVYGGYGFISEYPVERYYRDSRINRLFEGTNEINRLLISGMLIKNAMEGKIPLIQSATKFGQEIITFSPKTLQIEESPVQNEERALLVAKRIFLLLGGLAAKTYKENIREEEEVLASLSDIIIDIFVMESALLRAKKVIKTSEDKKGEVYILMTSSLCHNLWSNIEKNSKFLLSAMVKGDEKRMMFSALRKMLKGYEPPNLIEINRKIARIVQEKGFYPV